MDQERVKLIVHNMELLVQSLKKELEETSVNKSYQEICSYVDEYEPDYYEEED